MNLTTAHDMPIHTSKNWANATLSEDYSPMALFSRAL